jgi:hypothetical protein
MAGWPEKEWGCNSFIDCPHARQYVAMDRTIRHALREAIT